MEKEIIEGNAAINKFRGLNLGQSGYANDYHSNWNNLMLVVEKIEEPGNFPDLSIKEGVDVKIFYRNCKIEYSDDDNEYDLSPNGEKGKTKIEAVWKAVVKFIQWYNSINPQTP